jgi:hypothetical protein
MRKPRLPWKRGPAAWNLASRAEEIKTRLQAQPRRFLSLRKTAKLFGVSTQPVRDWIRLGHLQRAGPRKQIALGELERFIGWLEQRALPFPDENYIQRFINKSGRYPYPFQTLSRAQFVWPKGRTALTPRELADLTGCHRSLISKAIHAQQGSRLGRRKALKRRSTSRYAWGGGGTTFRCHWEITRHAWENTFPGTIVSQQRLPPLPRAVLFSTKAAAGHLSAWGLREVSACDVRRMIHAGQLEALRPTLGKRKLFVTRNSLQKFRKKALDSLPKAEFRA